MDGSSSSSLLFSLFRSVFWQVEKSSTPAGRPTKSLLQSVHSLSFLSFAFVTSFFPFFMLFSFLLLYIHLSFFPFLQMTAERGSPPSFFHSYFIFSTFSAFSCLRCFCSSRIISLTLRFLSFSSPFSNS